MRQTHSTSFAKMCRIAFYGFLILNVSISPIYPAIQVHAATYGALIQLPDLSGIWHFIQNFGQNLFAPVASESQSSDKSNIQINVAKPNVLQATTPSSTATLTPTPSNTPTSMPENPFYFVGVTGVKIMRTFDFSNASPHWQDISPRSMGSISDFILDPNDPDHRAIAIGDDLQGNIGIWLTTNLGKDASIIPIWTEVLNSDQINNLYNSLSTYAVKYDSYGHNPRYVLSESVGSFNQANNATVEVSGLSSIAVDYFHPGHIRVTPNNPHPSTGLPVISSPYNGPTYYQMPFAVLDSYDDGNSWTITQLPLFNQPGLGCVTISNGVFNSEGTFFVLGQPSAINGGNPNGNNPNDSNNTDDGTPILYTPNPIPTNLPYGNSTYDGNETTLGGPIAVSSSDLVMTAVEYGQLTLWHSSGGNGWSQDQIAGSQTLQYNGPLEAISSQFFLEDNAALYTSSDGASWSFSNNFPDQVNNYVVQPNDINNQVAANWIGNGSSLIYSTSDKGTTWNNKTGDLNGFYNGNVFITGPDYVERIVPPAQTATPSPTVVPTLAPTLVPTSTAGGATSTPNYTGVVLPSNAVAGTTSNADSIDADGEQQAHPSVGGPVDAVTGNYSYSATDFNLPASGGSLTFRHIYSVARLAWPDEGLGAGWTDNFNIRLFFPGIAVNGFVQSDTNKYTLQESNGSRQYFNSPSDGVYTAEPGFFASMLRAGMPGNYTYTILLRDNTRYVFNNKGLLVQQDHLAGANLTQGWNPLLFSYGDAASPLPTNYTNLCPASTYDTTPADLQDRLLEVSDNPTLPTNSAGLGKASSLYLCYDPTLHLRNVLLQNISTSSPTPNISFSYTNGTLSSVTDVRGKVWAYGYTQSSLANIPSAFQSELLTSVLDPVGNTVEAENYETDSSCTSEMLVPGTPSPTQQSLPCIKVQQQSHGNGSERTVIATFTYSSTMTTVTDGNGNQTIYSRQGSDPYTGITTSIGTNQTSSQTLAHDPSTFLLASVTTSSGSTTIFANNGYFETTATYPASGPIGGSTTRPSFKQSITYYSNQLNGLTYQLPQTVTDGAGNISTYTYDESGHGADNFPTLPTSIQRHDQITGNRPAYELYYYASTGWLQIEEDPNGIQTFFSYWPDGQVQQKILDYQGTYDANLDPTSSTAWPYNDNGNHPQNVSTYYDYDMYGRLLDSIDEQTFRDDRVSYQDTTNTITTTLNSTGIANTPTLSSTQQYDDSGRLINTTDADSYATIYTYDSAGRLIQMQRQTNSPQPHYATTSYTYDAADNLTSTTASLTSQHSLITATCYNGERQPIATIRNADFTPAKFAVETPNNNFCNNVNTSASGYDIKTIINYDSVSGKPSVITNPFYTLTYTYDLLGRTDSVTQHAINGPTPLPADQVWNYDYDFLGNINQITYAGTTTWRCYNMDNQLVYEIRNADSNNIPTCTVTSANSFSLAPVSYPTASITTSNGTNYDSNLTQFVGYDLLGRVTDVWDALNRRAHTQYDEIGRISSQTSNYTNAPFSASTPDLNLSQTMQYSLGSGTNTLTVTDYLNRVTSITYDGLGRQQKVTVNQSSTSGSDQNITTAFQYDGRGHVIGQSDPVLNPNPTVTNNVLAGGPQTHSMYDGLGNVIQITDPAGAQTNTTYDDQGNVLTVVGPDTPSTQFTYDNLSRLTSTQIVGTQLVTSSTDYSQYFTANPVVTVSDGQGTKTRYSYDAFGQLVSTIQNYRGGPVNVGATPGPNDTDLQTNYTYDALGRLFTVQFPGDSSKNGTRTYKYDLANRVSEIDQANSGNTSTWLSNYDPVGRQLQLTDPLNIKTQTTYNNVDDVTGISYPNSSTNSTDSANFTYSYSGEDKAVTMTAGGASTSLQYDALGRLISDKPSNVSNGVTFTYNADGQRTTMAMGSRMTTYGYCGNTCSSGVSSDALASITLSGSGWSGNNGGVVQYTYNQGHQVHTITMPNGVVETLGYDGNNRLTSIGYKNGSQTLFNVVYTLDNDGNRRIAHEDLQGAVATTCPNVTPTATITATATGSTAASATPTATATATITPSASATPSPSATATQTGTPPGTQVYNECNPPQTVTPTNTNTSTPTSTNTASNTATPTNTATATPSPTLTATPIPAHIDSAGIFRSSAGAFYLRLHNTTGNPDITVNFTVSGKPYPVVGDWTGAGYDAVGVVNQNTGVFTLCTSNNTTNCANSANQISFTYGNPNDTPLAGRWGANATHAGIGVYRSSNGILYLKNALTTGSSDYSMVLGNPGDSGMVGDWTGKNYDSPGVYRPSTTTFYLSNKVTNGNIGADLTVTVTSASNTDTPIAGDWVGQGHDGVGTVSTSSTFRLKNSVTSSGAADNTFTYGNSGDIPIAGHWQASYPPVALLQPDEPPAPIALSPVVPQSNSPPQAQPVVYQPAPKALLSGPTSTPTASMTATSPSATPPSTLVPLDRVITYGYDGVYRLTGASYVDNGTPSYNFSYGYDLNGNRTNVQESAPNQPTQSATYVYNANNTLKSATINGAPYNYQYDPDGNLQVVSTTGGTWTANYTYDSASRLKQANAGNLHTSYTYDGFNNRISQTNTVSGTTTNYLVDPSGSLPQLLGEFPSGSGSPTYYLPGLGQDSAGAMGYFNTDGLGSVRQLTDATGTLTYAANFDPYGGILNANILPGSTTLGYTGAPSDPSGLVYLNARFYNPSIGSFQTHDPLEGDPSDPASFNGYTYAGSNPTTYSDPSGKCIGPLLIACIVAIGAGLAFINDWRAQVYRNQTEGASFFDAVRPGNLNPGELTESAVVGGAAGLVGAGAGAVTFGALGITAETGTLATVGGSAFSGVIGGRAAQLTTNILTGQDLGSNLLDPGSILFDAVLGGVTGGILKSPDLMLNWQAGSDAFHPDVVSPSVANWGQTVDGLFGLSGGLTAIEDDTPSFYKFYTENNGYNYSRGQRLELYKAALENAQPASSAEEAINLVNSTMTRIEDEYSPVADLYANPKHSWDGRMYPVQSDNIIPNYRNSGLTRLLSFGNVTFVDENGAIQIWTRPPQGGNPRLFSSIPGLNGSEIELPDYLVRTIPPIPLRR